MAAAYFSTIEYLAAVWGDISVGEYAHGYLVLAIAAYLVAINRFRLRALTPCPEFRILPLLALAVCFWLLAAIADVQLAQALGLWMILLTLLWAALGTRVALLLLFPVLYILFALPIWFPLSQVLQDLSADVVFYVTRLLHIPAMRQENLIVLSYGTLSIEEACSGLRYLMAALTLSTLYAYLNYRSAVARVVVVLVAASAAIVSNFIRVFIVVYLGYKTDMQHPLVYDHLMLGWYLFGGMVVLLLIVDNRLAKWLSLPGGPDLSLVNLNAGKHQCEKSLSTQLVVWLLVAVLLISGPLLLRLLTMADGDPGSAANSVSVSLPQSIGQWNRKPFDEKDGWRPVFHGANELQAVYEKGGEQLTVYVAYYARQQQGAEMINDFNKISNKKVWHTLYTRDRMQQYKTGIVREQKLAKSNDVHKRHLNKLVWYQYSVAGRQTVNLYMAKILQAIGVLTGKPQAYVMAVAIPVSAETRQARKVLADFFADVNMFIDNDGRLVQSAD